VRICKIRVDPTAVESCLHFLGTVSRQQPTVAISDHANTSERHWRGPLEGGGLQVDRNIRTRESEGGRESRDCVQRQMKGSYGILDE
jgi:hypothetical protein